MGVRHRQLTLRAALEAGGQALHAELGNTAEGAPVQERLARLLGERLPCSGTLRLRCPGCRAERTLPFRCVGECEVCPRRAERRAGALARIIPRVPVRHWTLSLPPWLRAYLARDEVLTGHVARAFMRELFALVRGAAPLSPRGTQCGGVSLVHRVGDALNVNVHVHALVLDGVYTTPTGEASARFHPLENAPTQASVDAMTRRLVDGVRKQLYRRMKSGVHPMSRPTLDRLESASVSHRVATGPEAGASVRRVRPTDTVRTRPEPAAESVTAGRAGLHILGSAPVDGGQRQSVLRLTRYLTRPPVDLAALEPAPGGKLRYRLKHPFADGTTHVELAPQELAEKLAALVSDGATHRVAYHGVLAPRAAARWRVVPTQLVLVEEEVVPVTRRKATEKPDPKTEPPSELDCERCGTPMDVLTVEEAVDDPC